MLRPAFFTQKQRSSSNFWWSRRGSLGWWLNLTAPPRPDNMASLSVRESIRKAELTTIFILVYFVYQIIIIPNSLGYLRGALLQSVMFLIMILLVTLNRKGHGLTAAYGLISCAMITDMLSILLSPNGISLIWFPAYDLLALPVFVSALITQRYAPLFFAFVSALFIFLDFFLQHHGIRNGMGANHFDDIAYAMAQPYQNWWSMINRPIFLISCTGFFGWMAALTFEKALSWTEIATHEAARSRTLAQEAELAALQSQINPHFLYNTLSTMQMIAVKDDNERLATMIYTLGHLMQYALGAEDMVDVQQEIEHVESYLFLMKQRHKEHLNYAINISAEIASHSLPKLTVQPLVENAISHGLSAKVDPGTITIRALQQEDEIIVVIQDDGIGVSTEKLLQVQSSLLYPSIRLNASKHIGMHNIQARLQKTFGPASGLLFEHGEEGGVKVTVRLPL